MRVELITVGHKLPGWAEEGTQTYLKRLPAGCPVRLTEIPAAPRGKNADIERIKAIEAERIERAIPAGAHVILFDERGKDRDTRQWAGSLGDWLVDGRDIALIIGGPDGVSAQLRQRADERWRLSALTLPHPLVRVLVAEQLYRAWSLHQNHPYHRD
ncbi:23S rRNA (pseudouridine(1915)-N(3))-methyltransferase RlmH [Guyparkeria sp. 1SP6A2]|nr:23S rRNA (pseudouridine(1915)-N(3))-methyltransferase RlmH [Guyparkeria sp. 1SP6A2]